MIEININADSQEEFDSKRDDIVKALVGFKAIQPRKAVHRFQNESMVFYNKRFKEYLNNIKKEVGEVIDRHRVNYENNN